MELIFNGYLMELRNATSLGIICIWMDFSDWVQTFSRYFSGLLWVPLFLKNTPNILPSSQLCFHDYIKKSTKRLKMYNQWEKRKADGNLCAAKAEDWRKRGRGGEAESRRRTDLALLGGWWWWCPAGMGGVVCSFCFKREIRKVEGFWENPGNVLYGNDEIVSVLAVIKEDTKLKLDTCKWAS